MPNAQSLRLVSKHSSIQSPSEKQKIKKIVNEADVRDGKPLVYWSTFFTRSTTGTEVHGIIPRSVITRSTKSGGVTSYARLRRPSEDTSCQRSRWVFPARFTMRSSGSSEKKFKDREFILDQNKEKTVCTNKQNFGRCFFFFSYRVHSKQRNPFAPFRKTCRSRNTPAQAR